MDSAFWWNWWVQVLVAIGTIGAVAVAVFGQAFKNKFFGPQLELRLLSPVGELTPADVKPPPGDPAGPRRSQVRYYHGRVRNARRWSPATEVQVFLTRVEQPGPNGELQVKWFGELPMRWRNQEIAPMLRTVGREIDADLFHVLQDVVPNRVKWLQLMLILETFNLETTYRQPGRLVLTFQARGNEGDSDLLRVDVAWDGIWADGASEMASHVTVKSSTVAPDR